MADIAEAQEDPEENVPLVKVSPPDSRSGKSEGQMRMYDQRMDPNSAIQQSGPISEQSDRKETTGIAFSGGGIRSAAFCSGALRRMLQDKVPLEYLSCVSGGGYTGAAFLDWKRRPKERPKERPEDRPEDSPEDRPEDSPEDSPDISDEEWYKIFFDRMRQRAGYMCNWQNPWGILHSVLLFILAVIVVLILPCILWLPYAFPVAVVIDVVFGGILRENSTCPPSVKVGTGTSFLILELYENCSPPARRLALFLTTFFAWIFFFILSRIKPLIKFCKYQNPFRLLSIISGLVFAFTFFPWLTHDFLWPLKTWIKAVVFIIFLVLPFFFPIVRNVAAIFLFFYAYTLVVSWKVFKTEWFGALPYSDDVFYPILAGCAIAIIFFPFIGSLHQSLFNIFYRYRLSKAFFTKAAKLKWQDFFPACGKPVNIISNVFHGKGFTPIQSDDEGDAEQALKNRELTLKDLDNVSPIFISNITVNDWQIDGEAKECHQLMSFSSEGVKLIGCNVEEPPDFSERFKPKHMRLSQAMAISGAAVSFDMGSYETGLDMVLDLLNLLGLGMGDEVVSEQDECAESYKTTSGKIRQYVVPILVEVGCLLPLIAVPFVYWLGHSKDWVEYLVLVHIVIVVVLTGLAFVTTGSTDPGMCQRFIRWWIRNHFFVRFIRGFLSINNVGTHPPPVLRLSDGGHFENLALLPLLAKRLKKIVIFDGSCNPGGDKYADSLLTALKLAREKLHCSFVGMDDRDVNEDIRVQFLKTEKHKKKQEETGPQQRPRCYQFKVQYYDDEDNWKDEGEILFVAPRHPSESKPLDQKPSESKPPDKKPEVTAQPKKTWKDFKVELGEEWGEGPELTEREADRLTFCCCHCCHYYGSSHCISDYLLGRFPHHITANQFFTPDMFTAYHREGYAACVEANVEKFLKGQPTEDAET